MKGYALSILSLISLAFAAGCGNSDPVFDIEPYLEFVSVTPTQSTEGITDGMKVVIRFQDGDGDLGVISSGDDTPNLFVVDARPNVPDTLGTYSYIIPNLSPDTRKPSIQGTIEITMDSPYLTKHFIPPYIGPDSEDVSFHIHMVDRAGHISNTILTDPVRVRLQ